MKRYVLERILRSLFSIFCVVTIAMFLVYSQIDRNNVFKEDQAVLKLKGQPDAYINYRYSVWETLGYLDYMVQRDACSLEYDVNSKEFTSCLEVGSPEATALAEKYTAKGYTVEPLPESGALWFTRDYTLVERIVRFYSGLVKIDNPYAIKDENNPDLERKIYFGTDLSGTPALKCSGCEHKYLIYFNSDFPFIHQNIITFDLGTSYPAYKNQAVTDVMTLRQGSAVKQSITFETGLTQETSLLDHTCTYKPVLDQLDKNKFVDNYANCRTNMAEDSMIAVSIKMGLMAVCIGYGLGIPVGMLMARRKGKLADKLGQAYIVIMISIPSLAYISFFRFLGTQYMGLPGKYPELGGADWRSWVLPVISLALPQIAGLMMWTRRYMVDQSSSDYVKFARAKGLSESEIFSRHILKNAIIPIAQGIPGSIIGCINGAIITESLYAVSGMGKLLPNSIKGFNNSMVIALTFFFTFLSVFSLLLGDLLVTVIDPRISLATSKKGGRK